ncbi:MAG: NlpC/P60 family protein [Pseudomonadota bacterium]
MMMNNKREQVLVEARQWLGTPYRHQCSVKLMGADCLGLIRGVWRALYGNEPEETPNYSADWGEVGSRETMLEAANVWFDPVSFDAVLPGDLLIFRWQNMSIAKHAGILSGDDTFIHAYEKGGVVETTLGHYWKKRVAACFAFPAVDELES